MSSTKGDGVDRPQAALDAEWVSLMTMARDWGFTLQEVRDFMKECKPEALVRRPERSNGHTDELA